MIEVRELAGWPLDPFPHRPAGMAQRGVLHDRGSEAQSIVGSVPSPHLPTPPALQTLLAAQQTRPDLHHEMAGLLWSLGLVDLTQLQTFQRRLTLPIPAAPDNTWAALVGLNFAQPRAPVYRATATTITTYDPNLELSLDPLRIHTGSPFFEVATYRERWFLRDGYHRAYALLRAGITQVPAVLVQARTLHELNAGRPHFFPEEILLGSNPPFVRDFLDDALNITYARPPILRTIRVTVEEGEAK